MRPFTLKFEAEMNSLLEFFLFSLGRNFEENEKGDLKLLYYNVSLWRVHKNRPQTLGSVLTS